jgi:hypothetical protein
MWNVVWSNTERPTDNSTDHLERPRPRGHKDQTNATNLAESWTAESFKAKQKRNVERRMEQEPTGGRDFVKPGRRCLAEAAQKNNNGQKEQRAHRQGRPPKADAGSCDSNEVAKMPGRKTNIEPQMR